MPWLITSPLWLVSLGQLKLLAIERTHELVGVDSLRLLFGRWGTLSDDALVALADFWGTAILVATGTLAVQVLAVAAYDAALHLWCGRTVGKIALSLKLVPVSQGENEQRLRAGQVITRSVVTVILPGLGWVALFAALLEMSFSLTVLGIALLALSLLECAALRSSPFGKTCWHDRRARTVVVPVDWAANVHQVKAPS